MQCSDRYNGIADPKQPPDFDKRQRLLLRIFQAVLYKAPVEEWGKKREAVGLVYDAQTDIIDDQDPSEL
jgi:hypothetical protein